MGGGAGARNPRAARSLISLWPTSWVDSFHTYMDIDGDLMTLRPIRWIGSSYEDLLSLPEDVRREVGYALYVAQNGDKADNAKPLKSLGSGVLEVVENYDGDTYRAVYTVRFATAVYVLHAFQKKSKTGIATPPKDMRLIEARLKAAQRMEEGA